MLGERSGRSVFKSITFSLNNSQYLSVTDFNQDQLYTKNGDVSSITTTIFGKQIIWNRAFDTLNRPVRDSLDNLIFTDYQFDSLSRPTQILHSRNTSLISKYDYTYSLNGNITKIVENANGFQLQRNYSYDQLNRLVGASFEDPFAYDLLGNRTDYGATYNLINQRLEDNKYLNSFDIRGNLVERINKQNNEKLLLEWDNQNQLTRVENLKGTVSQYEIFTRYDSANRRIETQYVNKIDSTKNYTRKLVYNKEDVILELDENDKPIAFYIHGVGIDEPLAMMRDIDGDGKFEDNEFFYFTKDHLNS